MKSEGCAHEDDIAGKFTFREIPEGRNGLEVARMVCVSFVPSALYTLAAIVSGFVALFRIVNET